MKFSVLINNHNYGLYVEECVESVLAQACPAHEIIVVDDASTDDSLARLARSFGRNPKVKIVAQTHQGHTGAVATGVEHATGDIVCLLDADDRYRPNYLAELAAHYEKRPHIDLTFCQVAPFGIEPFPEIVIPFLSPPTDYDYGYTALLTYFGNVGWIGNFTSTLSVRIALARNLNLRETAQRFYIMNQADFSVVAGSSLLGARKFYLNQDLVEYRVHGKNDSARYRQNPDIQYRHWFNDLVRLEHYKQRSGIPDRIWKDLRIEMTTIPRPSPAHLEQYEKALVDCRARFDPEKNSLPRKVERTVRKWRKRGLGQA